MMNFLKNMFTNSKKSEIPESFQKNLQDIHERSDPRDNEESLPPPNENINIRCIWIIEIYPPNYIENLYACIENLGWNSPYEQTPHHNVVNWIKQNRQSSFGAGLNLNYIQREKMSNMDRTAPFPECFDGAFGTIMQIIPSATILMLQFIVNKDYQQVLEKPLREKYTTYIKMSGNTPVYIQPHYQKTLAVENARLKLYNNGYQWFKQHAPGFFSSYPKENMFPTSEFVTLSEGTPLSKSHYLGKLKFSSISGAWKSECLPGLTLWINDKNSHLYFVGNFDELLPEKSMLCGHEKNTLGLSIALMDLSDNLGLWSLLIMATEYESQLSGLRDMSIKLVNNDIETAINILGKMENDLLVMESSISSFIRELRDLCDGTIKTRDDIKLTPLDTWMTTKTFYELTKLRLLFKATYLKRLKKEVHQFINSNSQRLSAASNLKLARENIKVQHLMIILTLVLLLFTFITNFKVFQSFATYICGILRPMMKF